MILPLLLLLLLLLVVVALVVVVVVVLLLLPRIVFLPVVGRHRRGRPRRRWCCVVGRVLRHDRLLYMKGLHVRVHNGNFTSELGILREAMREEVVVEVLSLVQLHGQTILQSSLFINTSSSLTSNTYCCCRFGARL